MADEILRSRLEAIEREQRNDAEASARLESLLRRFVLRLCLASRGQGDRLDVALARTSTAMRNDGGLAELEPLLNDLSAAVAATEPQVVAQAIGFVAPSIDAELRGALAKLLEHLELDDSLSARAAEVRKQIESAEKIAGLTEVCGALAELIEAQRERGKLERADVQRILLQVDTRLHEFVSYLRGEAAEREAAAQSRKSLDNGVLIEVRQLATCAKEATELSVLQEHVSQQLEAIDKQLHDFRIRETERVDAYRDRAERMKSRVDQLELETRNLQASLQREQINATTDALTGIPNRLAYQQRIALEFKRWKRFGRPLCVAVWDIDRFKLVNDNHGHPVGDLVIKVVGRTLAQQVRETDFVARYGGEEFAVLLVDANSELAMSVAEKMRCAIETLQLSVGATALSVTVSCGLAEFRAEDEPEAVFERADRALYLAKQRGRNCCVRAG